MVYIINICSARWLILIKHRASQLLDMYHHRVRTCSLYQSPTAIKLTASKSNFLSESNIHTDLIYQYITGSLVIRVVYMHKGNLSPKLQALVRLRVSLMLNWCPWSVKGTVTCNGNEQGTNSCFVDYIWNLWSLRVVDVLGLRLTHRCVKLRMIGIYRGYHLASWVSVKYICANRKA